jgi:RNA 3'-terminal phosphate cyclase-like protein
MSTTQTPLRFRGHTSLASRLTLSTLLGRPVHISQIRSTSPTSPGLAPHEISLLRLLESITNGSHIEISYTGTILLYKPGLITGTSAGPGIIKHQISATNTRGISYFLIPLCLLAPFSKASINVVFSGPGVITASTSSGDISVDSVRTAILPLYAHFGIERNIELRITQRSNAGAKGLGGAGEVQLVFGHQVRLPKTIHLLNPGRVKKIRGVAYATGVSGSNNARMIESARGVLNPFGAETYIFSDVSSAAFVGIGEKGAKRKVGLGFGLSLVAESSVGALYSADLASPPEGGQTPEDIGKSCALQLLESIQRGGRASLEAAPTVITLMAMGSEDVGRIQLGRNVLGNEKIIQLARDLSTFGIAGWGIRDAEGEKDNGQFIVSVVGRGIGNVGKKVG